MLQQLDDHIKACHLRAQQCETEAVLANAPAIRVQLQGLGQQWLHVARSYEFIESMERFLIDSRKVRVVTVQGEDLDQAAKVSWWPGGEMPTDEGSLGGAKHREFSTLPAAVEFVQRNLSKEERLTVVIVFERP